MNARTKKAPPGNRTFASLPVEEAAAFIGERLRRIRKSQKVTLVELAKRTGVDIATISRIETGQMTGTIESHVKMATALGVKLVDLYEGIEEARKRGGVDVFGAGSQADVYVHGGGKTSTTILTGEVLKKQMMPVLLKIEVGGSTQAEENRVGTEKFIYVLDGAIEAVIDGKHYSLRKGQTLYFDASLEHSLSNAGKKEAKALLVSTPPAL